MILSRRFAVCVQIHMYTLFFPCLNHSALSTSFVSAQILVHSLHKIQIFGTALGLPNPPHACHRKTRANFRVLSDASCPPLCVSLRLAQASPSRSSTPPPRIPPASAPAGSSPPRTRQNLCWSYSLPTAPLAPCLAGMAVSQVVCALSARLGLVAPIITGRRGAAHGGGGRARLSRPFADAGEPANVVGCSAALLVG
jgi:hypothetical protein